MKIQDRLGTLQPDGNEGTVTVESGQGEGGSGGAVTLDANPVNRATGHPSPVPC
jgi:hypothetical protein